MWRLRWTRSRRAGSAALATSLPFLPAITSIIRMTEPVEPAAAEEPVPAPPRQRAQWAPVLVGLAGLVVGAVVVGGAWLVSGSGSTDTRAVKAPDAVGPFLPFDQIAVNKSPQATRMVTRTLTTNDQNSQRLSQSHGGAGAVVRLYSDQDLQQQLTLMIYRAPSAHPQFVEYQDTKILGLARPTQEAQEFGEVSCVVRNDPTAAGDTPSSRSAHAVSCSRTSADLTVEILPGGDLVDQPRQIARMVDEVWNSVS
jgi:hypothetical protein